MRQPRIALTMGDPAGVGPEIIFKALGNPAIAKLGRFVVIGERATLEAARRRYARKLKPVDHGVPEAPVSWLEPEGQEPLRVKTGEVAAANGRAAMRAIETAIALGLDSAIDAVVTAPIHKKAMELAGVSLIGHTEILADRTGTKSYCLMLSHRHLRVVHTTCHQAVRDAVASLTTDRVFTAIRLTYQALVALGVREPRIGVAGLNPHAGEGGLMGTEDQRIIQPAILLARVKGVLASGPYPPDTIFPLLVSKELDAVVVQYHDQGHIPFKLLTFRHRRGSAGMQAVHGVNVTLGLPFVRTSVDHGVAYDIAGKGLADPSSLCEAIRLACRLARAPKPTPPAAPHSH
jgi:4-hydroxythreonine-4-phosphate dehydrogenase